MTRKVIIIGDPGIDTTFAIALALHDPNLDVIGLLPCAGNVSSDQATQNMHILTDVLDPRKWPRLASAVPIQYETDGTSSHGATGFGDLQLPVSTRNPPPPADRVLIDLVREHPRELSVICLGPCTTLAHALNRDPEWPKLIDRLVIVGGVYREPGNAGPLSEFHFWLDPESASVVMKSDANPTIIPLDVTRQLILSPTEIFSLPNPTSKTGTFLRQIVPFALRSSMSQFGIEGLHLKDVLGVAAVALPGSIETTPKFMEIETRGEFTRGMCVVDERRNVGGPPNVQLGIRAAIGEIRQYIDRVLNAAN
ncbi:MAG: nucleoside hydrolase [Gemmataceae bacterium]